MKDMGYFWVGEPVEYLAVYKRDWMVGFGEGMVVVGERLQGCNIEDANAEEVGDDLSSEEGCARNGFIKGLDVAE